ncbi:hypothetical protein TrST_g6768 [Triparma strigata]|uniref:Glycosyl transferase CAP10 domain-containing protein n=1 Tax=Triparma strigata TaxID=1606541 RepID=A0A9W7BV35_9STRA|nr:hypothetical protein TrST_g6768 [Triparma strigata]
MHSSSILSSLSAPSSKCATCIAASVVVLFIVINLLPSNIVQQGFNDLGVPTPSQLYIKTVYSKSSAVRLLDEQCPKPNPRFTKAERIEYYLGPQHPSPGSSSLPVIRTYNEALDLPRVDVPHCIDSRKVKNSLGDVNVVDKSKWRAILEPRWMYTNEMLSYTKNIVAVKFGDGKHPLTPSLLRKIRTVPAPDVTKDGMANGILYKAGSWRHYPKNLWSTVYEDTPWEKKRNMAVWRGTTTGCSGCYPKTLDEEGTFGSRAELVRRIPKWDKRADMDIAVSQYTQGVSNLWGIGSFLSREEMMGDKLLLMPEGNDVATGLKWAMLSTSVVVMTKTTVESWLMEGTMTANVEYLEVETDWSNLAEVVDWCWDNDEECKKIGERGQCWMRMFLDDEEEEEIIHEVMLEAERRQYEDGICLS